MSTDKQINANRENAQHSTGPNTEEGKEISSFNRFKHGLCGRFMMIAGESQQDFNRLLTWLLEEHVPVTTEETMLVGKMAEHFWLNQRAQNLQSETFTAAEYEGSCGSLTRQERDQRFIVYMRYAANQERAYHQCLEKLIALRKQRAQEKIGFERLEMDRAQAKRRQEAHELRMESAKTAKSKKENQGEKKAAAQVAPESPRLSCEQLGKLFTSKILTSTDEKSPDSKLPDLPKAA